VNVECNNLNLLILIFCIMAGVYLGWIYHNYDFTYVTQISDGRHAIGFIIYEKPVWGV